MSCSCLVTVLIYKIPPVHLLKSPQIVLNFWTLQYVKREGEKKIQGKNLFEHSFEINQHKHSKICTQRMWNYWEPKENFRERNLQKHRVMGLLRWWMVEWFKNVNWVSFCYEKKWSKRWVFGLFILRLRTMGMVSTVLQRWKFLSDHLKIRRSGC